MNLSSAYHFRDSQLLSRFMADFSREALLLPVKKSRALRNRCFKGMRIGGGKPTLQQFTKNYQTQIVEHRDDVLATYLCLQWCVEHKRDLVQAALKCLSLSDDTPLEEGLERIQEGVSNEGHEQVIGTLVRNLGFDYGPEDLEILTAIICANVTDAETVREYLQKSLRLLKSNSSEVIRNLQPKVDTTQERRQELAEKREKGERRRQEATAQYQRNLQELDGRAATAKDVLATTDGQIQELELQIQSLQELFDPLKHKRSEQSRALKRANRDQANLRTAHEKEISTIEAVLETIRAGYETESKKLTEYQGLIADAEASLAQARAKAEVASNRTDATQQKVVSPDVKGVAKAQVTQTAFLESLIRDVWTGDFTSSSVTLEILNMLRTGSLTKGSFNPSPTSDSVDSAPDWERHAAQKTVDSSWSSKELSAYAYWKSLTIPKGDRNASRSCLISGLYHAVPENENWIDPLLIRLLETIMGVDPESPASGTPSHALETALEQIEDVTQKRQFGVAQVDLAFADGRLLTNLYDLMGGRSRLLLKRTLVDVIRGTIDVDEQDPTHELLDVVITELDSIRAVFGGKLANWRGQASLETIGSERQNILNAMAKLEPLVDDIVQMRLADCKQILSTEVSRSLRSETPEGYARLLSRCAVFLGQELGHPVWISSRFLFPLVLETARAGQGAEREARRFLKADLFPSFEKKQHPIGEPRRTIRPILKIANRGNTVAQSVSVMIMPHVDAGELVDMAACQFEIAEVQPRGSPVAKELSITTKAPLSALEFEYVITWRDASPDEHSCTGNLKLTAQRQVDWEKARINPYTLRSITDPEKLKGRKVQVDRLLGGVETGNSFYLTGQKRVGKTSVARVLNKKATSLERTLSVYITLGDIVSNSAGSVLRSMALNLVGAAPDSGAGNLEELVPDRKEFDEPAIGGAAFARGLQSKLPGWRFVYILDDLDELGESLYKGKEADSFFLHLRSLVDKGVFAFVFTGSERLPEILRHQGERLNQVSGLPLDYLTVDSLGELIREPVRLYLEFSDSAVEKIHNLTAGNPYYATQLCSRIHERMTDKKDYYVGPADVDSSASQLIESQEVSAFQHFWNDGVFDLPPERGRCQYMNAMILIALAEMERPGRPVDRSALVESSALTQWDVSLIEFRLNHLIERKVVEAVGDKMKLRIPLFAMWLRGRGQAAVRASFGERYTRAFFSPTTSGVPERAILSAAEDLYYQEKAVSEIQIKVWLSQFGDSDNQILAFKLLQRLKSKGYFSSASLIAHFKAVHSQIVAQHASSADWAPRIKRGKVVNVYATCFDSPGKSGSSLLYPYRTANQISNALVGGMDEAVEFLRMSRNSVVVVFVDDFIGTGRTCFEGFERFTRAIGETDNLKDHAFYVATLAAISGGVETVRVKTESTLNVIAAKELGSSDRAFSPDANIFDNEEVLQKCRDLCENIGRALEPKQPMGYENSQSLILFPHRCPNNTLPIFHKAGRSYKGAQWVPLFPRL